MKQFLTRVRQFIWAIWEDEAVAQRCLAVLCWFLGKVLTDGGTIPVLNVVVPGVKALYQLGPFLTAAAFYLGAGGSIPGFPGGQPNLSAGQKAPPFSWPPGSSGITPPGPAVPHP